MLADHVSRAEVDPCSTAGPALVRDHPKKTRHGLAISMARFAPRFFARQAGADAMVPPTAVSRVRRISDVNRCGVGYLKLDLSQHFQWLRSWRGSYIWRGCVSWRRMQRMGVTGSDCSVLPLDFEGFLSSFLVRAASYMGRRVESDCDPAISRHCLLLRFGERSLCMN